MYAIDVMIILFSHATSKVLVTWTHVGGGQDQQDKILAEVQKGHTMAWAFSPALHNLSTFMDNKMEHSLPSIHPYQSYPLAGQSRT